MTETNKGLNRRKFLTASLSGAVAAGLAGISPGIVMAQESDKKKDNSEDKIIYRKLGKTGMEIPIVSMGVGATGNPELIRAAYEKGIRHFDTAANYQYGRNEQMVGNVVKKLGVRDKVNIATKILIEPQRQKLTADNAKRKMEALVDGSLKRLKSDYVDILYVHDISNPADVNNPLIVEGMQYLKEKKKVRAIGISTHANMAEVINETTEQGVYEVILTSFNFTMFNDEDMLNAVKNAGAKGIGFVAMKTLAGGSRWPNPETRRNHSNSTIIKTSLKWAMRNKYITTCIPGFENFEHLDEDFSIATNLEYTPEEKQLLDDNEIILGLGFCRQCRQCLASCPHNTDIPTLMRTYMYAAQYGNFYLARETLKGIPEQKSLLACQSCDTCVAQCANSVDIAHKIAELKQIYA
jgi:predicted aldo/keto reductase-like oxidoreductase